MKPKPKHTVAKKPIAMLKEFMALEAAGGLVLLGVTVLSLLAANSSLAPWYFSLLEYHIGPMSLHHWINDGLMAVFFLLVGLEIKHEVTQGELATPQQRLLPCVGAAAGMAIPALVYLLMTRENSELWKGWAIPSATDIAFALGILSLLGKRVPSSLKVFLTALAIIDDLGAVVVIALFYGGEISRPDLAFAALTLVALFVLNQANVRRLSLYSFLGLVLWFFVLRSGIHATLAGVLLAFTIPLTVPTPGEEPDDSPLHRLEDKLDKVVPFFIVPLFGFVNAGISFQGMSPSVLTDPLTLGVGLGLLLGKVTGIYSVTFLLVKTKLAKLPEGATWSQFLGVCFLCGIGFTMSLFIGMLAFASAPHLLTEAKVGILLGSFLAASIGLGLLWLTGNPVDSSEREGNKESNL